MTYTEVVFSLTSKEDFQQDLLINALAEAGFDTFEETESGFNAYIGTSDFDEGTLRKMISAFDFEVSFKINEIEQENWNQVWESNFSPISIAGQCYIRATFHEPHPEFPYEIVIDPKMAFGTGHHQTTAMVIEFLLEENLKDQVVLDMGCGTGILAILADKLGALKIVAIDNDRVCYDSTVENLELNGATHIEAVHGSDESIPDKTFDVVVANINRNILLEQIRKYSAVLGESGKLIISGFYKEDLAILTEEAMRANLSLLESRSLDNWVAAKFLKGS